jgi:hypothetical protein
MAERGAATGVGSLLGIEEDVLLTVVLGVLTAVFSGSGGFVVGFVGELAGFHIANTSFHVSIRVCSAHKACRRLLLFWQIENCWLLTYGTFAAKFEAPQPTWGNADLTLLFADARNPGGPHTPHLQM